MELGGSLTERGDLPVGRYCPIERVLGIVGNRSAMVLLREAMYGATRFEELAARTGLTETTTARKLRDLVSRRAAGQAALPGAGSAGSRRVRPHRGGHRPHARADGAAAVGQRSTTPRRTRRSCTTWTAASRWWSRRAARPGTGSGSTTWWSARTGRSVSRSPCRRTVRPPSRGRPQERPKVALRAPAERGRRGNAVVPRAAPLRKNTHLGAQEPSPRRRNARVGTQERRVGTQERTGRDARTHGSAYQGRGTGLLWNMTLAPAHSSCPCPGAAGGRAPPARGGTAPGARPRRR